MRIQAEHLSYTYNPGSPFSSAALKDVSLSVEEGEFFGIIGHTGSGKSTFVQHLNALLRVPTSLKKYRKKRKAAPSNTVLKVGEFDLTDKKTDFNALRSKVGMVMQYPEYQLFAETVFEDVAFGYKNFAPEKPTKEQVESAVRDALTIVGLNYDEVKEMSPFDLSGGQKRRVAIAGVIVTKPEILVLDEPAAGLDPLGKQEVMELGAFAPPACLVVQDHHHRLARYGRDRRKLHARRRLFGRGSQICPAPQRTVPACGRTACSRARCAAHREDLSRAQRVRHPA